MGLAEWFETFNKNLQVKDVESISSRYKRITRCLNSDFWSTSSDSAHSLYVGSYGRNTAIQGFSDLDMIYELPYTTYEQFNSYAGNGQSALLQAVRSSLQKTYPTTTTGADGQVLVIAFTDNLTFEIVPAFVCKNGTYMYPDTNNGGKWKHTDPKPEIQAIRDRNKACNYNLIPLCRMMRAWKRKWEVPIGGLLIDTLAYQFIENYEYRDKSYLYYDYMCRDFFRYMANQNEQQDYWRAPGSGQWVYKKGNFQYKSTRCYNISVEAIGYESASPKHEWSAKQKWREIFGTIFPE